MNAFDRLKEIIQALNEEQVDYAVIRYGTPDEFYIDLELVKRSGSRISKAKLSPWVTFVPGSRRPECCPV